MTERRGTWWQLTERERQVLSCAAEGLSLRETGARLWLSEQTVKFHRHNLFAKLGAKSIAHAVAIAYETGLFTPETAPDVSVTISLPPNVAAMLRRQLVA